jgi:transcriptional regulator with XRE-family HTH domain
MEYIEKLNILRVEKALSFRQLGFMCELSESAVKKILYKKCAPLVPSIEKLCSALGTSLPELFCDAGEYPLKPSAETVALVSVYGSLPVDAQKHILGLINSLHRI